MRNCITAIEFSKPSEAENEDVTYHSFLTKVVIRE